MVKKTTYYILSLYLLDVPFIKEFTDEEYNNLPEKTKPFFYKDLDQMIKRAEGGSQSVNNC